jgi:short-subunit dehydrogenase
MDNWALITGASAGIGLELSKCFAADRINLVLVARNERRLNELAVQLRSRHGINVKVVVKDLSIPTAAEELFDSVREVQISTLINNAGFGWRGRFVQGDLQRSLGIMHVNMDALVQLTRLFVQPMVERGQGRIMNVASTAAFQPGPFMAIYYATKAFVLSFSIALAEELAGSSITVTTLCPGPTETEFMERAGMKRSIRGLAVMSAEAVAKIGYRGLMRGKGIVITGFTNKALAAVSRRSPIVLSTKIAGRMNQ